MPPEIDTIIVGAGPAGSHCARLLGQHGRRVVVLEKKSQAGAKRSCTGIIGTECLQLFPHGSISVLSHFNSATVYSPSGKPLRVEKLQPQAYMVDRSVFDNQLVQKAREAGAEFSFNTPVERIETTPKSVRLAVKRKGQSFCLEAKTVVIASGFGFRLTQMLGLGRIDHFAVGCQTEVATTITGLEVYSGREVAPGFFGWLAPFAPGRARLGLLTREKNAASLMTGLWEKLKSRGKVISPLSELHYGAIPLKPLSRTYANRALVIGDAAGQVKPTTGGGIYYGLLCAAIAADCIHEAIMKEDFSSARMSRYQESWHRKLLRELQIGCLARGLLQKLTDKQIDRIFDIILAHGIHEALLEAEDFSFDWHGRLILRALKYQGFQKPFGLLTRLMDAQKFGRAGLVPVATDEDNILHPVA